MSTKIKVGFNQLNRPAPLGYRRFVNATVLCFLPMITGIIQSIHISHQIRNNWMVGIVAVPFLLKGIGMCLGNGQFYSPSNETIDKQNNN